MTASPRGQTVAEFTLSEAKNQGAGVRTWLAGNRLTGAAGPGSLGHLMPAAHTFFGPLLTGEVGNLLVRSLDAVVEATTGLRVRLHLDPRSPLAAVPWELLPHPGANPSAQADAWRFLRSTR